jgi:hypothetical protein
VKYCKACVHSDTPIDASPCSGCGWGVLFELRGTTIDPRIPELQAQVAKMREVLEEITEVPKHFQTSDTLYGFIELLFSKINSNRDLAREALKDLPPT